MKLLPSNHDYLLDMFQHKEDGDEIWIGWRYYGDSTHFLVISCSALHPVTLDDIPNLMKELKVSDSDLLNGGDSGKLNSSENSRHIFLISQRKYLQNERGFKVSKHILSEGKAIPLKIMVFACLVDEKNEISVLRSENEDNIFTFPIKLLYRQTVKGLFSKRAYVRIEGAQEYEDGSICYTIPKNGVTIPLTKSALGKELIVNLPDKEPLQISLAKEYKLFYILTENSHWGKRK